VTVSAPVAPPTAEFSVTTNDLLASFVDQSTDADGSIVTWQWSFGDGAGSNSQSPQHTYTAAGTYLTSLTVTDDQGASDSYSASVTVTEPAAPPPPPEPVAPDAPSGLSKATAQEGRGKNKTMVAATLSWSHDATNTDYLVLEGCSETVSGKGKNRQVVCDWAELLSAIPGDASVVSAPVTEKGFLYRIKAVNGAGSSPWSNEVKL
jgi:PKD repeat protein